MALTADVELLNTIPAVAFCGNKIPLHFQASTNLMESDGTRAEIVLTWTAVAIADEYFDLLLNGETVRFTCKAAPDNSGIQFHDNVLSDTLNNWVALTAMDLKKNYLIVRYYDIVVVDNAITLTAKAEGADYNQEFTAGAGIDVTVTETNKTGTNKTRRAFYGITVLLYCNDEFVTERFLNVDSDGLAVDDIAEILKSYLVQKFEWPESDISFIFPRPEAIAEWYFYYGERWGDAEYTAFKISDTYFVMNGGLSFMQQANYNAINSSFWNILHLNKYFLSWAPSVRIIGPEEPVKLYFVNHIGATTLKLKAKLFTATGDSTITMDVVAAVADKAVYEMVLSPAKVGYNGLADQTLVKIEIWIDNQNDNQVSETRTFIFDYAHYEHTRYFLFKNSLGTFEWLRTTGLLISNLTYDREIADIDVDPDYTTEDREVISVSNLEQQKFTLAMGWLNRYGNADEYRNWLRDFSLSKEVYQLNGDTLIPIRIISDNLGGGKDRDTIKGFSFEFVNAFTDEYFTEDISAQEALPSVLYDANKFGWFDWEEGMEGSPTGPYKWHNLSNAAGDHSKDLIPTNPNVPIEVNDGVVVTDSSILQSADFASSLAQPVFMYYLFKQVAAASTFLLGDNSGGFDLRTYTDDNGIIHATAGTYSPSRPLTANEWHILRVYFNGANSKLIVDNNAPVTWNCGANSMANFCIGFQKQTVKEWIIRKNAVGETEIFNYLSNKMYGGDSRYWTPRFLTAIVVSDVAIDFTWTGGKLGKVYRSTDGITYTQIGTGKDGYSDSELTAYTLYYYKVKGDIFSSVVSGTTLYPLVLNDANKFGWFDWEKGMEGSPAGPYKWHNLSKISSDHSTDLITPSDVWTPLPINNGVVATAARPLGSDAFGTPLVQPVFMYALLKIPSLGDTFVLGDTSGGFDLRSDSSGLIMVTGGSYSPTKAFTANEFHIVRAYINGANSKLIIDDGIPTTGNFGTNAMSNFCIGFQTQTIKEWIIRKSAVGEADIYAYLVKKKMNSMDSFFQKYYTRTMNENNQLNIVMAGDSILGRMYDSEIALHPNEATGLFPPNMWQQNVPYKVLQKLQYPDADVKYYNLQAWIRSGFILRDPVLIDGQRMYQSSTLNDYAEITITGASYFKILHYTESVAANQITITFNGSAPSAMGLTGVDTFNTLTGTPGSNYYKWANSVWSGLNPATTYVVRITNTGGGTSSIWGCESWSKKRINVIVSAHGGFTAAHQLGELQGFYGVMYNSDLIIHDLSCLNDSYSVHNKGGKSPASAAIVAVADDFIFALSSGTFTNYSGLSLTAGQYAEYNGSNWIAGSSEITAIDRKSVV